MTCRCDVKTRTRPKQLVSVLLAWAMLVPGADLGAVPMGSSEHNSEATEATGARPEEANQPNTAQYPTPTAQNFPASDVDSPCSPLTERSQQHQEGSLGQPQVQSGPSVARRATTDAQRWGDITIAAPKIWGYERVNTYLDGLLRDIEAVSLADLTRLDPNAQNAGAIQFIQSALEIGVQYNQAIGANNNLLLQSWQTQMQQQNQQLQQYYANIQSLQQQRTSLITQLTAATSTINQLQQLQLGGTTLSTAQQTQLTAAQTLASTLDSELTNVNTAIQSAGPPPTAPPPPTLQTPTVTGPASGTSMSSTFNGLTGLLNNLPSGLQNELTSALQSPSYPATKRLDSFITLLYERLAREVSALQDDLTRDPNTLSYLVQFDVGLYPASRSKNHVARVEFELDQTKCPGCKVYSIYPGQSSYNVANYKAESRSKSFWGNLGFLIGLGVSAAYRKQEDTLHGSLVQSVYTSGFQDDTQDVRDPSQHSQRFGWNYGTAPFEQYVSPGTRTTFAIITVPRTAVESKDNYALPPRVLTSVKASGSLTISSKEGEVTKTTVTEGRTTQIITQNAVSQTANPATPAPTSRAPLTLKCFDLGIRAYWGLRDNPFYSKAHFLVPSHPVDRFPLSVLEKNLTLLLPNSTGIEPIPPALRFEPGKLHVTSLEYNPVYLPAAASSSAGVAGAPTSSPGISSGSGLTSTTTNACASGQCAAVVIVLDQPIDPNLVVTVNGTVLTRVRDWRGRATSILPAPESGSDLATSPTPASSTVSQSQPQSLFRTAPGILESDQLGPDTWYTLDSHRILLTISRQIAPEEEFPIIRLGDPSKKVLTLPLDLDQGFSEIITNGFHLAARTPAQLSDRIRIRYGGSTSSLIPEPFPLHAASPYPVGTFLPLFLRNPDRQNLYAYLGETGRQILIGFRSDSLTAASSGRFYAWLPGHDQVILEDRNLDLAWSLDCSPQASELVCDVPQQQIAVAYETVSQNCTSALDCAAFASVSELPFVSSLELWVQQYDPNGTNAFQSGAAIGLGLLPIEADRLSPPKPPTPPIGFVSWRFESAAADAVAVKGCGYTDYFNTAGISEVNTLRILGRDSTDANTYRPLTQTGQCSSFTIPTDSIVSGDVVLVPAHVEGNVAQTASNTPMAMSSASLRPFFGRPTVTPTWKTETPSAKQTASFPADCWTIDFSAGRVVPGDRFSQSTSVADLLNVSWPGQPNQSEDIAPCPASNAYPKTMVEDAYASRAGKLHLRMVINRKDLPSIPKEISVFRDNFAVAKLRIPQILLPSKLKLEPIGQTQFSLTGPNADLIDAVTLQDGKNIYTIPTAIGAEFALVTLPEKDSSNTSPKTSSQAPSITSVAVGSSGQDLMISGQGFGDKFGTVTFDSKPVSSITAWSATSITVALPQGENVEKIIKLQVTPVKLSSPAIAFTISKTFKGDCAAVTGPCISGVGLDTAGPSVTLSGQGFGSKRGTVTFRKGTTTLPSKPATSWTDSKVTVPLPAGEKPGQTLQLQVTGAQQTSDPFSFTIGTNGAPSKSASPAPQSPSQSAPGATDQPITSVAPSTYAVVPLFRVSGSGASSVYMPLDVTGNDGKPLTFTVAKAAAKPTTTTPPASTTTITVTKSPPASAPAGTTPAPASQPPAQNQ